MAILLLPAGALAADPTGSDPSAATALETPTAEPSPAPTSGGERSLAPEATPDPTASLTPEPTPDSSAPGTATPTAGSTASGSPDDEGTAPPGSTDSVAPSPELSSEPSPERVTSPDPTDAPGASQLSSTPPTHNSGPLTLSTSSESSTSLNGYRYTIREAALYRDRDTSSPQLLWLEADTQLSVSESAVHSGREWITGTFNGTEGYIPASELSMTSAPKSFSVTRYTRQWSNLHSAILGSATATVPAATVVATHSAALDYLGRRWVYVSFTKSGVTRRGYQPWWHTTTLPVSAGGTWTAIRATALYMYPYSQSPVARSVAEGTLISRRATVTDTDTVRWTRGVIGSSTGWIRSADLAPPFKQFVWNRRYPVTQQYTNYYCVPASVQTELNIGLRRSSTSNSYQKTIYTYGRKNLGYWTGGVGLDPQAWERALSYFSTDAVDYVDATYGSYYAAIKAGALQMRRTGLPVGLLVYYGNHAWTMIGYTATADPLRTSAFRVTGVYVAAPFVRWTDPPAGTYLNYSQFARKMTPYIEQVRWTRWNGLYTIVLPG
jgi:hypothetical protein